MSYRTTRDPFLEAALQEAHAGLAAGGDAAFLNTKIATGRYYMARHMPATALHLARIQTGSASVMALEAEAF